MDRDEREVRKIVEKYGYRVVRCTYSKHRHVEVDLPPYRFITSLSSSDPNWLGQVEREVRRAARELCPRRECPRMKVVYADEVLSIHRCDTCNQSEYGPGAEQ